MAIPPGYTGPVKPVIHSMTRRADHIDYTDIGFYMITIRANPRLATWSAVIGDPYSRDYAFRPSVTLFEIGEILTANIHKIETLHPGLLEISRNIVMPDHLHFIVYVKEKLNRHLGSYINSMKSASTSQCRKLGLIPESESLFEGNYNDRPVRSTGQLERQKRYIEDNPRRWLIKRRFPDLFKRMLRLRIANLDFDANGNIFLLRQSELIPVYVRSKWDKTRVKAYAEEVVSRARQGAVLISPFISRDEKDIMNAAIECGASIILIKDYTMGYRGKAYGRDFELTSQGRMLIIARSGRQPGNVRISYHRAHEMNRYAEWIAGENDLEMSMKLKDGNSGLQR